MKIKSFNNLNILDFDKFNKKESNNNEENNNIPSSIANQTELDNNSNNIAEANNFINNNYNLNIEKDNKEKEDFLKFLNKDIERLEKIRNNNSIQEGKEDESYIYEIDNFINLMKEKRNTSDNNRIKDINFPNKSNSSHKILSNFENDKYYLNYKKINNNITNNYMNDIGSFNKIKLPINKSSRLQNLLNDIKNKNKFKSDIFNNIDDNTNQNIENNSSENYFNNINNNEEEINEKENDKNNKYKNMKDLKLFDETMFRKIKERNFDNKNHYRKEFKFKDNETNKNYSHIYLDKVKEDLINISSPKILDRNDINIKKIPQSKLIYSNSSNDFALEIMPANDMNSLFKKK